MTYSEDINKTNASVAAISFAFTYTALYLLENKLPNIYYYSVGWIQKYINLAHDLPVISDINELCIWWENTIIKHVKKTKKYLFKKLIAVFNKLPDHKYFYHEFLESARGANQLIYHESTLRKFYNPNELCRNGASRFSRKNLMH
jgi:hypothetical protein